MKQYQVQLMAPASENDFWIIVKATSEDHAIYIAEKARPDCSAIDAHCLEG
jgi:hypothetical protein